MTSPTFRYVVTNRKKASLGPSKGLKCEWSPRWITDPKMKSCKNVLDLPTFKLFTGGRTLFSSSCWAYTEQLE